MEQLSGQNSVKTELQADIMWPEALVSGRGGEGGDFLYKASTFSAWQVGLQSQVTVLSNYNLYCGSSKTTLTTCNLMCLQNVKWPLKFSSLEIDKLKTYLSAIHNCMIMA